MFKGKPTTKDWRRLAEIKKYHHGVVVISIIKHMLIPRILSPGLRANTAALLPTHSLIENLDFSASMLLHHRRIRAERK
jgi:hypothetical protein